MRESDYLKADSDLMRKLKTIPTLIPFKEEDLEVLVLHSKIRTYEEEEVIFEEGSNDRWLFFMISGKVRVVKQGKELATMACLGDIFGEMGIIDGSARSASVYAVEETNCLAANASDVDNLSGSDRVTFGYVLYRLFSQILANRLRLANEHLIEKSEEGEDLNFEWK